MPRPGWVPDARAELVPSWSPSGCVRAEDQGGVVVEHATVAGDENEVVLLDLSVAARSTGLNHAFRKRRHSPEVERAQLAAAGIGGQATAGAELAVLDEGPSLTFAAKPVVLQRHQRRVGAAVVQFADVDVLRCDADLAVEGVTGDRGAGHIVVRVTGATAVACEPLRHRQHV